MQAAHAAHDDDRGIGKMFLHGALRQFPDGADERALERSRSPVHQGSRRIRLHPSIDEML